jgi:hypothetical protein
VSGHLGGQLTLRDIRTLVEAKLHSITSGLHKIPRPRTVGVSRDFIASHQAVSDECSGGGHMINQPGGVIPYDENDHLRQYNRHVSQTSDTGEKLAVVSCVQS